MSAVKKNDFFSKNVEKNKKLLYDKKRDIYSKGYRKLIVNII